MTSPSSQDSQDPRLLPAGDLTNIYRHVQGALVRSGASLIMWLFALIAFFMDIIRASHFAGISASVAYLILINPLTLWALKRTRGVRSYKYLSLLINLLEIIGYTAIMYFLGGIEGTYLILIYAALITYVGVTAPRKFPFIIATGCAVSFSLIVILEHFGFLPSQKVVQGFNLPWGNQLAIIIVAVGLLFVVAFIASYTANLLKRNRGKLRQQNDILAQANERLQKEIAERQLFEAQLTRAKAEAEGASRTKSEFLANMSHELRTPLNHIIGFTELVADKQCGELNEVQEEYLNDVLQSSRHLLSLINDILDLSKVEAGKLELQVAEIPLPGLLGSSLNMVKEKALKHGIRLSKDVDGIPEVIQADERKLKQILYNLLSNAVKFTPDGGSVNLAARYLEFKDGQWFAGDGQSVGLPWDRDDSTISQGRLLEVSIKDTGIGIQGGDLERIFNPFEQLESSANRRYPGTGLGLSLSKRFVELHGGRIWATSEGIGKGSCFRFVIPVQC